MIEKLVRHLPKMDGLLGGILGQLMYIFRRGMDNVSRLVRPVKVCGY
jgi:hypothetical protein